MYALYAKTCFCVVDSADFNLRTHERHDDENGNGNSSELQCVLSKKTDENPRHIFLSVDFQLKFGYIFTIDRIYRLDGPGNLAWHCRLVYCQEELLQK